jgi:hypothetical protein
MSFHSFLFQSDEKIRFAQAKITMPYGHYIALISPLQPNDGGTDGVDWTLVGKKEVCKIEKFAIPNLNYWFGTPIPGVYNWQTETYRCGTRSDVEGIELSYGRENFELTVKLKFLYPAN